MLGYICGSIPFGLVLGKIFGHGDIRAKGSGNIGATNMLRVGGKKIALITLLLDMFKGAFAVMLVKDYYVLLAPAVAMMAVAGHMFPIWLKFKGGKGVATAIGCLIALSWVHGLMVIGIWLATAAVFRYSSLAALIAIGAAPVIFNIAFHGRYALPIVVIATLVYIRHFGNIQRLLAGEESKIGKKA